MNSDRITNNRHLWSTARCILACFMLSCAAARIGSAQALPVANDSLLSTAPKPLPAEQVSITPVAGIPNSLHRSPGVFLLLIDNRSGNSKSTFVVDRSDVGEGQVSPNPVLLIDGRKPERQHHRGALLNLDKSEYFLKANSTGHILCTITIE